jgi:hypothetical protein
MVARTNVTDVETLQGYRNEDIPAAQRTGIFADD